MMLTRICTHHGCGILMQDPCVYLHLCLPVGVQFIVGLHTGTSEVLKKSLDMQSTGMCQLHVVLHVHGCCERPSQRWESAVTLYRSLRGAHETAKTPQS